MYETVTLNYMEDATEATLPAVHLTDDIFSIQIASLALIYVSAAGKTLAKANDLVWRRGRGGKRKWKLDSVVRKNVLKKGTKNPTRGIHIVFTGRVGLVLEGGWTQLGAEFSACSIQNTICSTSGTFGGFLCSSYMPGTYNKPPGWHRCSFMQSVFEPSVPFLFIFLF